MQEKLREYSNVIKDKWDALGRTQKIQLIVTVVLIIATLITTIIISTRPKWVVLVNSQEIGVLTDIRTVLNNESIRNQFNKDGTAILVDERDKVMAQAATVKSNVLNSATFTFADALDATGMSTTESTRREMNRHVAQGELALALKSFEGVNNASVYLVLPNEKNYFQQSTEKASAAVTLNTNKSLSSDQSLSIARFICRAVKGLEMENIEIVNQYGETIYSGLVETIGGATSDYDLELLKKRDAENKIKGLLNNMFDDVQVMANLVLKMNRASERQEIYTNPMGEDTNAGLLQSERTERQTVTDSTTPAEPGVGANNAATPQYQMQEGTTSNASTNSREANYYQNKTERVIEESFGDVIPEQSSIAVVAYKFVYYDEENLTRDNLLNGMTWTQFKDANRLSVPMEIDQSIINTAINGTGVPNISVIGFETPIFIDREVTPIQVQEIIMFAILALLILMLAYGLLKKSEPEEALEIEPELSVSDMLVSTQLEEQKQAEVEKLQEIDFNKDSIAKQQIDKFVTERPEAVAQLLRNWLSDEWE